MSALRHLHVVGDGNDDGGGGGRAKRGENVLQRFLGFRSNQFASKILRSSRARLLFKPLFSTTRLEDIAKTDKHWSRNEKKQTLQKHFKSTCMEEEEEK